MISKKRGGTAHKLLFLLLFILTTASGERTVHKGVLDLTPFEDEFSKGLIIAGDAAFFWQQHLTLSEIQEKNIAPDAYLHIPSDWNEVVINQRKINGIGYATVAVEVILPKELHHREIALKIPTIQTAYRLYLDSTLITQVGVADTTAKGSVPQYKPQVISLGKRDKNFTLLFHISNFSDHRGGPWEPILIGSFDTALQKREFTLSYDIFFASILFILAVYHIMSLFMLNRSGNRGLFLRFALFAAIISLRTLERGEKAIILFWEDIPFSVLMFIDYFTFFAGVSAYHNYLHHTYRKWSSEPINTIIISVSALFLLFSLVTPLSVHSQSIVYYQLFILFIFIYHFYISFVAMKENRLRGGWLLFNTIVFVGAVTHDILADHSLANTLHFTPIGVVVIATTQAFLILEEHAGLYVKNVEYNQSLKNINRVLSKFVPMQFFTEIKKSALEIKLGDNSRRHMAVLFCDIRNFTTISERMSAEQNYSFVNEYIALVSPHITENGGYIDKFLGDGIMALFMDSPQGAVNAAQAIAQTVRSSKLAEKYHTGFPLRVGIGIHYGEVILGIVGTESRLEDTVIGNVVNTTFKMDEQCKEFGITTMISEELLSVTDVNPLWLRNLGNIAVKGKRDRLKVYELFDSYDFAKRPELQDEVRPTYEKAVTHYEQCEFREALTLFQEVLILVPSDTVTSFFLGKCREKIERGITY